MFVMKSGELLLSCGCSLTVALSNCRSHCSESSFSPRFNEKDGHVERKSQNGLYEIENGRPR